MHAVEPQNYATHWLIVLVTVAVPGLVYATFREERVARRPCLSSELSLDLNYRRTHLECVHSST